MPAETDRPFTRRAGLSAGLTDATMKGPGFRRLFRGVYVRSGVTMTPVLWAKAAQLVTPAGSFASHHTAAEILGTPVPHTSVVHLGTTSALRSRIAGITLHRYAALPPLWRAGGVTLTAPERTFLDLASELDLVDLVVLGDGLVNSRRTTPGALQQSVGTATGAAVRRARRAAAYVRAGAQSAPESRLRMLLVLGGLPEPQTQVAILDAEGWPHHFVDLGWPVAKVAVEYDGRHHIERKGQWQHDLLRREDLEQDGWRFVVVTSPDLFGTPGETIERVVRALRARGLAIPRVRDAWRSHFPERPRARGHL